MKRKALRFASIVTVVVAATIVARDLALGDVVTRRVTPSFSQADLEIIQRNESLSRIVSIDPDSVRRFLDALQASGAAKDNSKAVEIDRTVVDPDLKRLERSSPEAAHDILQIIKAAGSQGRPKSGGPDER